MRRLCLTALPALFCLLWLGGPAGPAWAQPDLSHFFSPHLGRMAFSGRYQGLYSPEQTVAGQDREMGFQLHELYLKTPLRQSNTSELALLLGATYLYSDTQVRLPDSGLRLPQELWHLGLGGFFRQRLTPTWLLGLMAEVGSASDEPFEHARDTSLLGIAYARWQQNPTNAWLFMIMYHNLSDFLAGLPIPGLAWMHAPSPGFNLVLGFPFTSLHWAPAKRLRLRLLYIVPQTIYSRATVLLGPDWDVFASFRWTYESFFLSGRQDDEHTLFFYEKKALLGLGYKLAAGTRLELTAGWAFDREIFQGEDYNDRHNDRLTLQDGAEVQLVLRFSL